ncbi:MAG: YqiJ family protein [Halioglobus sp.]|nr:YqiJ family protein [Halioglobus sp.]
MLEFVLAVENRPFSVAIGLMLLIGLMEGIGSVIGAGIFSVLDSVIPDFAVDADVDTSAGDAVAIDSISDVNVADSGSPNALSRFLGWLRVGKVPILMLLVILLTSFGLLGYLLQSISQSVLGAFLPAFIASLIALVGCLPVVRVSAVALERVMPDTETSAVSAETFVGKVATVTIGTATSSRSAEAKLTDKHGQTHYVRVQPEEGHEALEAGANVLLVRKEGNIFIAIRNTDQTMVDN